MFTLCNGFLNDHFYPHSALHLWSNVSRLWAAPAASALVLL